MGPRPRKRPYVTARRARSEQPGVRLDRLRCFAHRRGQILDPRQDAIETARVAPGEALVDDMVEKAQQRRPITLDVDDEDRLVVQSQLLPGDDFEHLLERAEPARQ